MLTPVLPMHGLGGAKDLPVPAPIAISGGTAALVVSFCVLILAWRRPRYDAGNPRLNGRPLPRWLATTLDSAWFHCGLRALGMALTAYFVWALLWGPDLVTNPIFGTYYVLLWVGIVPASLLFGRIFYAMSPIRTLFRLLSRATGSDTKNGLWEYPAWLGYWPAAGGLFAFVWQELVNPQSAFILDVRLWLALYLAIMVIGAAMFGEIWLERADPFEVYSSLLAKLSFWGRREDGTLVWRSPLANLATLVPKAGIVPVLAVLFGSTAFDSYKDSLRWVNFVQAHSTDFSIPGLDTVQVINTAALFVFCATIGITFTWATKTTGVEPGSELAADRSLLPKLFAHSVVPIIVGYMTAHYLSYFVEEGQMTILQWSDPMVKGQNLLGTANWTVDYWLSFHPTFLATTKVCAVVLGHIVGVVAAHDRAVAVLPKKHQVTGQLGLLVIMVAYTATGLYLLFGAS
jgi:hypothetical protein